MQRMTQKGHKPTTEDQEADLHNLTYNKKEDDKGRRGMFRRMTE